MFVCHCGSNIAGAVDIPEMMPRIEKIPGVALARDFMFTCSAETQDKLSETIKKYSLGRVVIAACSPKTHEPLFRNTMKKAGVNPYLLDMANIRNQCSWVHGNNREIATKKSLKLIRAAVARAKNLEPLREDKYEVVSRGLVLGGGLAGMTSALSLADQGFEVHLVEKTGHVGGFAMSLTETLEGASPPKSNRRLEERVRSHPKITLGLNSELTEHHGYVGAFKGTVSSNEKKSKLNTAR